MHIHAPFSEGSRLRSRKSPMALILCASSCFGIVGCASRGYNQSTQNDDTPNGPMGVAANKKCDIVIVGGTTAAAAAAVAASKEIDVRKELKGKKVCLLEPTDWPGGQLTASGVPAVDFEHHSKDKLGASDKLNIGTLLGNNSKAFNEWMKEVGGEPEGGAYTMKGNHGRCWVSFRCYEPWKMVRAIKNDFKRYEDKKILEVYYNTVPKSVRTSGRRIIGLEAIRREPLNAEEKGGIYNRALSSVLEDWYSRANSSVYKKEVIRFEGSNADSVFMDATEWGEVLALSKARFLQGLEEIEPSGATTGDADPSRATCGQAIVFPMALEITKEKEAPLNPFYASSFKNSVTEKSKAIYSFKGAMNTWDGVWTYRRFKFGAPPTTNVWHTPPAEGDITQINVANGNDYVFDYLFPSKRDTLAQVGDWKGGVRIDVIRKAEIHALGYYEYLRENGGALGKKVKLNTAFGTGMGLSKVPYMRDTRRSVGVRRPVRDENGRVTGTAPFVMDWESHTSVGKKYVDTVGIGLYAYDVHPVEGCRLPQPKSSYPKPFYLSLSALTNETYENLLVAGKTMAQDFITSGASRLHPIEFASGTAAGVTAAYMVEPSEKSRTPENFGSATVEERTKEVNGRKEEVEELKEDIIKRISEHQPLEWSVM